MNAETSCEDARMAPASAEWSDLRILLALARAGSMVAAAKQLGIQHTTVSRRIDALEEALGTRLIGRARTGVTLTDAGQGAIRAAEEMERAHEALTRHLTRSAASPEGCVRVSMTEAMSSLVLPTLKTLSTRYPALEVHIQTTSVVVSIEKGDADIGLRTVKPTAPNLVSQRIAEIGWSLYGSTDYLARKGYVTGKGHLAHTADLTGHDLVGFDASLDKTAGAIWLAQHERGNRIVSRANTISALAALVAAGQGIGVLPCFSASGLDRLTPDVLATTTLYAVVHEEQRDVPRVRVGLDHPTQVLPAERATPPGAVDTPAPCSRGRSRVGAPCAWRSTRQAPGSARVQRVPLPFGSCHTPFGGGGDARRADLPGRGAHAGSARADRLGPHAVHDTVAPRHAVALRAGAVRLGARGGRHEAPASEPTLGRRAGTALATCRVERAWCNCSYGARPSPSSGVHPQA